MRTKLPPRAMPVIADLISRGVYPRVAPSGDVEHMLYCPECDDLSVSAAPTSLVTDEGTYDIGTVEVCWECPDVGWEEDW